MTRYDDIAARVERIKYLSEALSRVSPTSAQSKVIAEEIHGESAAYLALVDAQRGVDQKDDGRM